MKGNGNELIIQLTSLKALTARLRLHRRRLIPGSFVGVGSGVLSLTDESEKAV